MHHSRSYWERVGELERPVGGYSTLTFKMRVVCIMLVLPPHDVAAPTLPPHRTPIAWCNATLCYLEILGQPPVVSPYSASDARQKAGGERDKIARSRRRRPVNDYDLRITDSAFSEPAQRVSGNNQADLHLFLYFRSHRDCCE